LASRRVEELLDLVKLPRALAGRLPGGLSGGQKQRVNLARALAAEPDLILCDEVTSALDTVVGAAVLDLIAELRRELGVSYLFISHDLHTVRAVCDEIVVMQNGRKLAQVTRADYDRGPHHPYYEQLARAVPELRRGWLDEIDAKRARDPGDADDDAHLPHCRDSRRRHRQGSASPGPARAAGRAERFGFELDVRHIDWASCDYYQAHAA